MVFFTCHPQTCLVGQLPEDVKMKSIRKIEEDCAAARAKFPGHKVERC